MPQFNNTYDVSIDYFAVLGVHYGACEKTVKMMYRKLARRYHPDVSTIHNAQSKFQEIAAAYEILKKYRDAYCRDFERQKAFQTSSAQTADSHKKNRHSASESKPKDGKGDAQSQAYTGRAYRSQKPINGKDRLITYPLTLRYAIRLLRLGSFYIPGLKVQMKFTREAFEGKTFRLEGKGYSGLFGGKSGDYLVRFNIKLDSVKYELKGGDIYGVFSVPKSLLKQGETIKLESPCGSLELRVPKFYRSDDYIKIRSMGLPSDHEKQAGDFYARLIAA